jgi:hypothetical protein
MTLEEQVTRLELSKRLDELGVKQDSLFYWVDNFRGIELCGKDNLNIEWSIHPSSNHGNWSAFTVAELGEMLPNEKTISCWSQKTCCVEPDKLWSCTYYTGSFGNAINEYGKTEADARAKMLINLIENNLLKL